MPRINFHQASRRMHLDAVFLTADCACDRTAGAGHFFGLASECGLKYLLLLCGGLNRDAATGELPPKERLHVNRLVDPTAGLASSYAVTVASHTHAKYFANLPNLGGFSSWRPEHRYFDTSHPDYPKTDEPKWESAAFEIQAALDEAQMDGQPIY